MLIIPELETVLILVPRTGSGSLRRALMERYPKAMLIYRHMEADGVPLGYDRWRRVGLVRHPVDRLFSLYKFLRDFGGEHDPAYIAAMRNSVDRPFSEWLLHNEVVFTSPYDRAGLGRYWPNYTVRHPLPENRKSQWVYLRPDLGTDTLLFDDFDAIAQAFDVMPERHHNRTGVEPRPEITSEALDYLRREHAWDFQRTQPVYCEDCGSHLDLLGRCLCPGRPYRVMGRAVSPAACRSALALAAPAREGEAE